MNSRREQFGLQITITSPGDNSAVARFSDVEIRNAGQGLKLGKYPIHFHLIGVVTHSYVRRTSVHHSFNRGVAVHGVTQLRVEDSVLFDIRGHAVFLEDGTEMGNIIEYNLVALVRPVY